MNAVLALLLTLLLLLLNTLKEMGFGNQICWLEHGSYGDELKILLPVGNSLYSVDFLEFNVADNFRVRENHQHVQTVARCSQYE